ncbi:MAG: hypothetical protein NO475_01815 [Candidatus Methanomethylicia archaeon]|nr:hypothetical protein [Candidatus Verstraetearchaeota archaeon]MCQ5336918.1 hypothetical protein [Candidatus Methanomethylicia archaeon]
MESLRIYTNLLKVLSEIIDNMADVEKKYGKKIDEIAKELLMPDNILELSKKVPPDIFNRFISILLRLSILANKTSNLLQLMPDEKKNLAKELKSITEDMLGILNELENYTKK